MSFPDVEAPLSLQSNPYFTALGPMSEEQMHSYLEHSHMEPLQVNDPETALDEARSSQDRRSSGIQTPIEPIFLTSQDHIDDSVHEQPPFCSPASRRSVELKYASPEMLNRAISTSSWDTYNYHHNSSYTPKPRRESHLEAFSFPQFHLTSLSDRAGSVNSFSPGSEGDIDGDYDEDEDSTSPTSRTRLAISSSSRHQKSNSEPPTPTNISAAEAESSLVSLQPSISGLNEEDRFLVLLREESHLPWKVVARRFQDQFGRTHRVPMLQMRYKRLRERLGLMSQRQRRSIRRAHSQWRRDRRSVSKKVGSNTTASCSADSLTVAVQRSDSVATTRKPSTVPDDTLYDGYVAAMPDADAYPPLYPELDAAHASPHPSLDYHEPRAFGVSPDPWTDVAER